MLEHGIFETEMLDYKNNNFNILRFFAAVLVICGHMYHLLGLPVLMLGGQAVSTIGVEIFFLISGYLIMQSYTRDSNILRYTTRRFFRIIPGLVFLCIITVVVIGPIFTTLDTRTYFSSSSTWGYLRNILLFPVYSLPGVFEHNIYPNAVNGSLWTLVVEIGMYVVLPLALFMGNKLKHQKIVLVCFAVTLALSNSIINGFYPNTRMVIYGTSMADVLTLAPFFFVGVLFSFSEVKKHINLQLALILLGTVFVLQMSYAKTEILMLAALSYFIFSFALAPNPFFGKYFVKNDYSYGMYLYAFLVQQILASLFTQYNITFNIYLMMSIVISFVFAYLSWHLIEKPALDFCKRILKR